MLIDILTDENGMDIIPDSDSKNRLDKYNQHMKEHWKERMEWMASNRESEKKYDVSFKSIPNSLLREGLMKQEARFRVLLNIRNKYMYFRFLGTYKIHCRCKNLSKS